MKSLALTPERYVQHKGRRIHKYSELYVLYTFGFQARHEEAHYFRIERPLVLIYDVGPIPTDLKPPY